MAQPTRPAARLTQRRTQHLHGGHHALQAGRGAGASGNRRPQAGPRGMRVNRRPQNAPRGVQ
eukprot:scaffold32430_cov39-Isochrysis_galbana.AAC.1